MRKSTINNNINKIFYVLVALFVVLIGYLLYVIIFQSDEILDNPYNDRDKSTLCDVGTDELMDDYICY
jgi:hypothetical protein